MIPQFPKFKKLALSDRDDVGIYTQHFLPYSDFNFTSILCWDTDGTIQISELHGNLVVRFLDYLTGAPFYSFIGLKETSSTAHQLLTYSRDTGCGDELKLIPEMVAQNLNLNLLLVEEDPDHSDYIYPLEKLTRYDGNRLRAKRNFSNRFKKRYAARVTVLDCADPTIQASIGKLFNTWSIFKKLQAIEVENEQKALRRFLDLKSGKTCITTGIFDGNDLIAFAANECLRDDYAIMHFEKADETYVGIYSYLMEENSKMLFNRGMKYLNFEQDLGLPGLRLSKKSFHPVAFLKKYRVRDIIR